MATSTSGTGGWPPAPQAYPPRPAWTAGRIISVVIGSVLALISLGLLATGAVLLWADQTQRTGGYLTVPSRSLVTSGSAVTSDVFRLEPGGANWVSNSVLGKVRVRVTPADPARPVFLGIARASDVQSYLAGSRYATVTGFPGGHGVTYTVHPGNASPPAPLSQRIWVAQVSGTGAKTLTWQAQGGSWIFVVMNASGAQAVSVTADAGATVPILTGVAVGFLVAGAVVAAGAAALIVIPVRMAGRRRREPQITG
jgi:hypothetical protein